MGDRTWPQLIGALLRGADLSTADTAWAMAEIMSGNATPATLSPTGTYTGKVDVTMSDSASNQDACQGALPGVVVAAHGSSTRAGVRTGTVPGGRGTPHPCAPAHDRSVVSHGHAGAAGWPSAAA